MQYAYTEMSGGQNNSRLTSMTYPNGRVLDYNYNSGLDSTISRLSSISDSSATLESYLYLGLGTVVKSDHPANARECDVYQPERRHEGTLGGTLGDVHCKYKSLGRIPQ